MRLTTLFGSVLVTLAVALPKAEDSLDSVANADTNAPPTGWPEVCGWLWSPTLIKDAVLLGNGVCYGNFQFAIFETWKRCYCTLYSDSDCLPESKMGSLDQDSKGPLPGNFTAYACKYVK